MVFYEPRVLGEAWSSRFLDSLLPWDEQQGYAFQLAVAISLILGLEPRDGQGLHLTRGPASLRLWGQVVTPRVRSLGTQHGCGCSKLSPGLTAWSMF